MALYAGIFPAELTALRGAGLLVAVAIVAFAVVRRRSLRNVDVLILLATGLGLAIVAAVMDAHHGTATVDSHPGYTRFTLRLPLWS